MYIESEDECSLYSIEEYKRDSTESEYNYEWSNQTWNRDDKYDVNRVSELFGRNSLYTEVGYNRESIYLGNQYDDNEDLNPIIDLYTQSYEDQNEYDNSEIEPVMSLPLSPRQYMFMKRQWNKQLDMELSKASLKQNQKTVSWSGFSDNSLNSISSNNEEEYPTAPRNSNASDLSGQSKKSTRSWKSFFSKFSNKKKKQIKFYDDLLQKN